jgi:hypothetical protein
MKNGVRQRTNRIEFEIVLVKANARPFAGAVKPRFGIKGQEAWVYLAMALQIREVPLPAIIRFAEIFGPKRIKSFFLFSFRIF